MATVRDGKELVITRKDPEKGGINASCLVPIFRGMDEFWPSFGYPFVPALRTLSHHVTALLKQLREDPLATVST